MIPELLPVIDHVEITDEGDHLTVWPVWRGVDRPRGAGDAVRTMKLAKRLEAAILAGKAVTAEGVGVDIHGQTYVIEKHHTLNRMLSADLKRLGF